MSYTDSFIEEVSEEVRRDRLYGYMHRYAWIAIVAVLALVSGAAWNEWSKAQARTKAQTAGDAILAALQADEPAERVKTLQAVRDQDITQGAKVVAALMQAAEQGVEGEASNAQAALESIATDLSLPEIYRLIASFKTAISSDGGLSTDEPRIRLDALNVPGNPLRLLAAEQLALLDIKAGTPESAIVLLKSIIVDSEVTAGLRQRATQLIIALGGEPDMLASQN